MGKKKDLTLISLSDNFMHKKILVIVILFGLLVACTGDSDGIDDDDLLSSISREAMCVASAERLQLYDMAEKHRRHGKDSQIKILQEMKSQHKEGIFESKIGEARILTENMSKNYHAMYLTKACGEKIRTDYLDSIN